MIGIGIGVGLQMGKGGAVAPPGGPKNLLLWSEAFDNAVWLKTTTSVVANDTLSPIATTTADRINDLTGAAATRQVSLVVAVSGAGAAQGIFDVSTTWTRYQVTAAFDGTDYTFSVYMKQTEEGIGGRIRIDLLGGLIRCSLEDVGDTGAFWAWGAQLEVGSTATDYEARTI